MCITSSTGVLEFVQNSMTIRDYLVDDPCEEEWRVRSSRVPSAVPSAHRRYHKGEIDNTTILKQFARVKQESKEQKVRLYRSVKQQFTPVLHYFFLERFFHPQQWFYSTTNFTSTLSISSIVGYIVGLGDRHLRNIMIDSATGQLIHIDFGILFEKGRLLSVPEMVPFRLTRELVDCLGLEGVDGLLRAQMEFCLRLLRLLRQSEDHDRGQPRRGEHAARDQAVACDGKAEQDQKKADDDAFDGTHGGSSFRCAAAGTSRGSRAALHRACRRRARRYSRGPDKNAGR